MRSYGYTMEQYGWKGNAGVSFVIRITQKSTRKCVVLHTGDRNEEVFWQLYKPESSLAADKKMEEYTEIHLQSGEKTFDAVDYPSYKGEKDPLAEYILLSAFRGHNRIEVTSNGTLDFLKQLSSYKPVPEIRDVLRHLELTANRYSKPYKEPEYTAWATW